MDGKSAYKRVDGQIAKLAAVQDGVVALRQLLSMGLSRAAVESRVGAGRLHPVHRGVFALGRPGLTPAGRRRAALLSCGDGAVLSHRTAADLWGMRPSNAHVFDVTIPSRSGRQRRRGLRVHRGPLPASEVTSHHGLPVTTPARTLLDLAAALTPRALERALDEAERLGLFDAEEVDAVLDANRCRSGRARLAAVLAAHRPGTTRTRNGLEELMLGLCRANCIPQPRVNAQVGPYYPDFLWPEQRLIAETDGRATHRTMAAFERDRARDAYLTSMGYRVVRYTKRRLTREPEAVVRELRLLLAAPTPGRSTSSSTLVSFGGPSSPSRVTPPGQ